MPCPFLKEGLARYCHAAPVRKLILDGPGSTEGGLCRSAEYKLCELTSESVAEQDHCPHLEQLHVQYCCASPFTKLVPFSDSPSSTCSTNAYRYCDSYLRLAHPHSAVKADTLSYAPNHFWLETDESGLCHVGLDEFLADVMGKIDGVTFVTASETRCPALMLTIHGFEWFMSFPNPMKIYKVNSSLRGDPGKLISDPYGGGWLFEGGELPNITNAGLVSGPEADAWQLEQRDRLAREIHDIGGMSADGGLPVHGIAQLLNREQLLHLLQHFFSESGWMAKEAL